MTTDDDKTLGTTRVTVTNAPGRTKLVTMPLQAHPVAMGVRDEVAGHYGIADEDHEPTTTTLDFLVAAVVACLTGTLGGRLASLGQDTWDGLLVAEGVGELVVIRGVIRIKVIDVHYTLALSEGVDEAKVRRVHETHTRFCPAAQSVTSSIGIRTRLTVA